MDKKLVGLLGASWLMVAGLAGLVWAYPSTIESEFVSAVAEEPEAAPVTATAGRYSRVDDGALVINNPALAAGGMFISTTR